MAYFGKVVGAVVRRAEFFGQALSAVLLYPRLCRPHGEQMQRFDNLLCGVRCEGVIDEGEPPLLSFAACFDTRLGARPSVSGAELAAVPLEGVAVVEKPECRQQNELAGVLRSGDKGEGQTNPQFVGIVFFCEEGEGGEAARMLHANREGGPEAAPAEQLSIRLSRGVVRADGCTGGDVGLSLECGGNEKGGVVVLLVEGKQQRVGDLAAGDGRVLAEEGVAHPDPEAEGGGIGEKEVLRLCSGLDSAAVSHDPVGELHAAADVGGMFFAAGDAAVGEANGAFDESGFSYDQVPPVVEPVDEGSGTYVPQGVASLRGDPLFCELFELLYEARPAALAGPQMSVGRPHAAEGIYGSLAVLVAYLECAGWRGGSEIGSRAG